MSGETFHVGVLAKRGRFVVAEPFFERGRRLVVDPGPHARTGQLVLVREGVVGRGKRNAGKGPKAKVVKVIGRPDVARDVIDLATFTIDPATARDFDDAISAEVRADGEWRIWVHIADVSAYVRPGS